MKYRYRKEQTTEEDEEARGDDVRVRENILEEKGREKNENEYWGRECFGTCVRKKTEERLLSD